MTSATLPILATFSARRTRSVCNEKVRREPSAPITERRAWTQFRSAPAASNRGRRVSAMSSSADKISTLPNGARPPSGQWLPADIRAAMSAAIWDFPIPGSPEIKVVLPRANRPSHSQSTGRGSMLAKRSNINRSALSDPSCCRSCPFRPTRNEASGLLGQALSCRGKSGGSDLIAIRLRLSARRIGD